MFTDRELRELLALSAVEPVLSVYLNMDPTAGNADFYKLRLRNLLKTVELPADVQAVEHYINNEFNWVGRSIAIFSCSPQNFFKAYSLAIPVRDLAVAGMRPAVKPLADLLDDYGGYGVALVDKQGARLFHFHLGELQEQEGVMGELVKHVKRGGASSMPGRRGGIAGRTRHQEELVERNIKDITSFSVQFFEQNNIRRVLIGGIDENTAQFKAELPKFWQALVLGTFPMAMTASHSEVLAKAMQIGQESQRSHEARRVNELITLASKGSNATLGMEKVLGQVHQGSVQTLFVTENYSQAGYVCSDCGWITVQEKEQCDQCSASLRAVEDVVELAVASVWQQGGEVVFTHGNSALAAAGSLGAILRY